MIRSPSLHPHHLPEACPLSLQEREASAGQHETLSFPQRKKILPLTARVHRSEVNTRKLAGTISILLLVKSPKSPADRRSGKGEQRRSSGALFHTRLSAW